MPLVSGIEVNDLQKLQKMQAEEVKAELPTATTKLKDRTEPIKWEVRENISGIRVIKSLSKPNSLVLLAGTKLKSANSKSSLEIPYSSCKARNTCSSESPKRTNNLSGFNAAISFLPSK